MITLQMILFVLALTVGVGIYGVSVWNSIKRPQPPKPNPASSSRTQPQGTEGSSAL
jgi:hypothetical protein